MFMKQIFLTAFTVTMITILTTINWHTLYMCASCTYDMKIIFSMRYNYPAGIMFINDFTFISYIRQNNILIPYKHCIFYLNAFRIIFNGFLLNLYRCLRRKFEQLNDALKTMSGASPLYPQYMKLINAKTRMHKTQSNKLEQKTNDDTQIIKVAK